MPAARHQPPALFLGIAAYIPSKRAAAAVSDNTDCEENAFRASILKEKPLATAPTKSGDPQIRAEASFRKEERAKDGAKAMMEYQANGRIAREKMAQLKALRLAKEAAEKAAQKPDKPAAKRAPRKKAE
jgi:hypothetical protein